ncbi:feruloyl esterase [Aspergillus karnatakaensis]|uniref:putative feruloyl esterase n=1 Tax=Aspergillus karnatakaensis TaxID=1810916 RepID=UPI003CCD1150
MNTTACSPAAIQPPLIYGAEILSLTASWATNFTLDVPATFNYNHGDTSLTNATFCNITVTYTHPGYADHITVETWLPPPTDWNSRLQATGGGGWQAGRFALSPFFMASALAEGYATTTTDAGLGDTPSPLDWALRSPGNVDIVSLQNLASRSLADQADIGKSLVRSFYGRDAAYSYWSGCSQGGRQGLTLAQRYPRAYDGIAASAPAQAWTRLTSGVYYPALVKGWYGVEPLGCELEFLTGEAVRVCDGQDGVVDGLISDVEGCQYSPFSSVNQTFVCGEGQGGNRTMALSWGAAVVAEAAWGGPKTRGGERLWFGVNPGSDISGLGSVAVAGVNKTAATPDAWFGMFVAKNASFDPTTMTLDEYVSYFEHAVQEFSGFIDAADPDLSEFRNAGGKMIAYHGMADPSIPTKGTEFYYDSVKERLPDVHDFYRFFESPGLGHCAGGAGGQPTTVFNALRRWVENGTAPETLPVEYAAANGTIFHRKLCPYPQKARYVGGDASVASSFRCE